MNSREDSYCASHDPRLLGQLQPRSGPLEACVSTGEANKRGQGQSPPVRTMSPHEVEVGGGTRRLVGSGKHASLWSRDCTPWPDVGDETRGIASPLHSAINVMQVLVQRSFAFSGPFLRTEIAAEKPRLACKIRVVKSRGLSC